MNFVYIPVSLSPQRKIAPAYISYVPYSHTKIIETNFQVVTTEATPFVGKFSFSRHARLLKFPDEFYLSFWEKGLLDHQPGIRCENCLLVSIILAALSLRFPADEVDRISIFCSMCAKLVRRI
jgi:hypothetical protein